MSSQDRPRTFRRKNAPPRNHLDIDAWRLPTLARNQAGDWLMPSQNRQLQHTDVQVVARGGEFFVYAFIDKKNLKATGNFGKCTK